MKKKILLLLCCVSLGYIAFATVPTLARPMTAPSENAVEVYFEGGEKQLRKEINHSLDLFEEESRVVEIQPILEENGCIFCMYLTDSGRFGSVCYPKNKGEPYSIILSEGEVVNKTLLEMGKAVVYSEYKIEAEFKSHLTLDRNKPIKQSTITNKSFTLGETSETPKIIYIALADIEITE